MRYGGPRRLRVCESLSLGEKRFVAVVQFETQQFLIGGGAASVNLLARLGETADFGEVLTDGASGSDDGEDGGDQVGDDAVLAALV